jgi:type VI secretion system protein VasG
LARGSLRTIAATTWSEYKRYIEKDPALTRRFQVVKVEQPNVDSAVRMLRHLTDILEQHHGVTILDEAVRAAVELSNRYVPDRQLPDKAISLLDTAAARVAVSQHAVPARVDDCRKNIEALETEAAIVRREIAIDEARANDLETLETSMMTMRQELSELEVRWETEAELVQTLLGLHEDLVAARQGSSPEVCTASQSVESQETTSSNPTSRNQPTEIVQPLNRVEYENEWGSQIDTFAPPFEGLYDSAAQVPDSLSDSSPDSGEAAATIQERFGTLQQRLREIQGDEPLVLATVDSQAVATVVAEWTGIPVGRMLTSQIESVLTLEHSLAERVVGQDHAMAAIARRIHTSRAGLDDPDKPVGVFLLAGPSGVGKTETAIRLSELLFGGQQNLITINMSEFQESHTVSTLKGAPPGYVGYGEGGVLTEAVRRKPYSVVLLDEVEKAHPDTHEIFFQVFDKGRMDDGEGRTIDFKNTLILLTSNVGSEAIMRQCSESKSRPTVEQLNEAIRPHLLQVFAPALLGRMVVVPFFPLNDENLAKIIELKTQRIIRQVRKAYDASLVIPADVIDLIRRRCTEVESGGRMIDAILTNTLLPEISSRLLRSMADRSTIREIRLSVHNETIEYHLTAQASLED